MANEFNTKRTAVVAVDFQVECLDPKSYWPIVGAADVIRNAKTAIDACRRKQIPIIYTKHVLTPNGSNAFRLEPLKPDKRPFHSTANSPEGKICAELEPAPDDIIVEKQRWTGFYCTQLDLVLRKLDIEHLIMFGVWTEACFETTVWDALWRDYRITIVKDACGSATAAMHMTAILDLANWLYGGMIVNASQLDLALAGQAYKAWRFSRPTEFPYTLETVTQMYELI